MWFLPSRSRACNVKRLFNAWNITEASTPGVLRIDADDSDRGAYENIWLPMGWCLVVGPRMSLGELTNEFFQEHPHLPWYGLLGDDVVPTTPAWDTQLVEAAGLSGMSYPNDLHQAPELACHMVLGGDLVREMGWLSLPGLERLYIDTVWTEIARARKLCSYLPEVVLEHRHFSNHKAPMDTVYLKPRAGHDRITFEMWRRRA